MEEITVYGLIYDLMLHVKDLWDSISLSDLGFANSFEGTDYTLGTFFFVLFGAGTAFEAMYSKWKAKGKEYL